MALLEEIRNREIELDNLKAEYSRQIMAEKEAVLKSKSVGLSKSMYLWGFEFESSCCRTSQYLEFHRVFKREFTALLRPYCNRIEISKPNHFDFSGFFETKSGRIYWFSLEDLRWSKDHLLIRTAGDFKDYMGGSNEFINMRTLEKDIMRYLK